MSLILKILLGVDALLLLVLAVYVVVRLTKEKSKPQTQQDAEKEDFQRQETDLVSGDAEIKETQEIQPPIDECETTAVSLQASSLIIGDLDDAFGNEEKIKRVSFSEKMLTLADDNTKEYYNQLYNKFISYRKLNPRVSSKCVSVRFGGELIAKISFRGKTMKLHLALNAKDFDENVYFQKDLSNLKSYQEVPMAVKVKSERGLKNALKLIETLVENKGVEKKQRFNTVDALSELTDF